MKVIKIDIKNYKSDDIDLIVEYFKKGKVVVLPTDTIYGFHCLASDSKAIDKIYEIKKRNKSFPVSVLVKSYCMLHNYAYVSAKQDKYIRTIWSKTTRMTHDKTCIYKKKPTTFIFKSREKLPKQVSADTGALAIRLPKNDFLITIIKKVNIPLISTSLNMSTKKDVEVRDIKKNFKVLPDLVVDAGDIKNKKSSKIIDISDINNIKIVRK